MLAPFAVLAAFGILLASSTEDLHATGALALVCAPALLAGPALVARAGGQRDLAAPLVLGTLVLSGLAYSMAGPRFAGAASLGPPVGGAFAIAAALAAALPEVRDLVLAPLARVGDVALALLAVLAIVDSGPALDPFSFLLAAIVLALGAWPAAIVAALSRRDTLSAVTGAGSRDATVASAVAFSAAGPAAGAVALAYGILLAISGAAIALRARLR